MTDPSRDAPIIRREDRDDVTVLILPDSRIPFHGTDLSDRLFKLWDAERWRIVLDMHGVEQISSLLVGKLILAVNQVNGHGGTIKLVGLQPMVSSVFKMTRLSRILEIFDDVDSAVRSFGPPAAPSQRPHNSPPAD